MAEEKLMSYLSGPIKAKRVSSLEHLLLDANIDDEVINTALTVENVSATLTEYRDRERHLEGLLKVLRKNKVIDCDRTQLVAFRYLLGSLYVNFEKFWGPTIRVIIGVLDQNKYQPLLLQELVKHLKETNDIIYDGRKTNDLHTSEDRPDHVLHRNFILQIIVRFVSKIESKCDVFMDEFFRFVRQEMLCSPFIEKLTKDNLQKQSASEQDELVFNESAQMNNKGRSGQQKSSSHKPKSKRPQESQTIMYKRKTKETFITISKIIASFQNVRKIPKQDELKELLLEFLCCRDISVQKAAFNCLLVYEDQQLKPHANRCLRLLNDKVVKSELSMFSIDENESNKVLAEHREKLIPIVMRILYGRMRSQIGHRNVGRDKADVRKKLVMQFISGCSVEEIVFFFELLFYPYHEFINVPYSQLETILKKNVDYSNYCPLSKIHAMLDSISAYMKSVAHTKAETIPQILKLINIIIFHVITPLEDPELCSSVSNRNIDLLKALRRECINLVTEFFKMFEYYQFSQEELDFVFRFLVWNSTPGFIDKNYATSTPILKLIEAFASNRVYHQLLVKRNKHNQQEFLLNHIIELYTSEKTLPPVLKFITTMLADIIHPDRHIEEFDQSGVDYEPMNDVAMLRDEDMLVPDYSSSTYRIPDELYFHQEIMISYIPKILARLEKLWQEFIAKKGSSYKIGTEELLILSSLSRYLTDSEHCLLGAKLLLKSIPLQKKADLVLSTLRTVKSLLRQVVDCKSDTTIVDLLADILSQQHDLDQRQELCEIIKTLADSDRSLLHVSQAICLMNQTSAEFLSSPDLVKWNEGFQVAFQYIATLSEEDMNKDEDIRNPLMLLIHQTSFIVNDIDRYEFSVRENCNIFYERLAQKLQLITDESALLELFLNDILLEKFIKRGLRETNEMVKHTYFDILRTLSMNCHSKNKTLAEFFLFCSDNQDLDFWLNIRHIQLHNRSKALARIITSDKIRSVSPRTLSAYFLPIASGFLFSKTYKSVASLSENSIKLIGMICRELNWRTYESTLNYYLDMLTKANATYQSTNIKLITEILRNFNYDLTSCEEAMQFEEEDAKLEKRMQRRRGPQEQFGISKVIETDALRGKKLEPHYARIIYESVTKRLIPKLNSCLHEMTRAEFEHDKNMSDYLPEKEEIKRIPMAYAIVQLLNLLPGRYVLLRDQLPALFLKLSTFLKSKSEQVRKTARLTLIKIMAYIGPAYLPDLIRILRQNLDKGFQIHVLNYTINAILDKLVMNYGDLDVSTEELVNLCFQEIFGRISEDKEVSQILAKTYEAKTTKSYDTLMILSTYISAEKLAYLMNSIKETLKTSSEPKKVNKLSTCIQRVFAGLAKNEQFPLEKLYEFIRCTIEESIPSLKVAQKVDQAERPENHKVQKEDRYLITKDLPRDRIKSRINEKGNFHMLIENSLRLLLHTFEVNKSKITTMDSIQNQLDDFINLLATCLKSSSPKCVMRSLKCIHFIAQTKIDLPSFKTKCNYVVKRIFVILSLYNGVGMVQGDNFEMISMCFKTLTLLLLHCEHVKLCDTQTRALLSYIEQDLHDTARQGTAFGSLNSILHRKLEAPELSEIMAQVANLLVTSEDESVRNLSVKTWQTYLLEYRHEGNRLNTHLTRFLRQLDYEFIDGRRSVLNLFNVVVSKFPENILRDYHDQLFSLLSMRLVNEESKEVRATLGRLIGSMEQRLPDQQVYAFNKFIIPWASGPNDELKLLGIKLMSVYAEQCQDVYTKAQTKKVLSILNDVLNRRDQASDNSEALELNEKMEVDENNDSVVEEKGNKVEVKLVSTVDKLGYHALRFFKRLLDKNLIESTEKRYISYLKKIWHVIATDKLGHWHIPTVITSCELYLQFIREVNWTEALNVENPSTDNYLEWNAKRIVRTLCDKFIDLLDRVDESKQLIRYITEGLILLGQAVVNSSSTLAFEKEYLNSFSTKNILDYFLELDELPHHGFDEQHLPQSINDAKKRLNLMWLSVKVVNQARKEAALYRMSKSYRRQFVLRWTAAISQELGAKRIMPYLLSFLLTPVRELTDRGKVKLNDDSTNQNCHLLCEDLLKFMKSLIGVENFNKIYSKVQLHFTRRRVERKKKEAIIKVKDPSRGVKRKMDKVKRKTVKRRRTKIASRIASKSGRTIFH